ncbi:MAG TPA: SWIM zinc finger family protein [Pirellulales bacterium]|nr:SWIM zinc finger family protein [Pirellulales bacterium]
MALKLEASAAEACKFIRSLPRTGSPKRPSFVVQSGDALRLSQRESRGAVRFSGTHRVRVLEPLLSSAKSLRLWADDESGVTGWEVLLKAGRFFLLLSPEVFRGFSGEGQALSQLAGDRWQAALPQVQAALKWQTTLNAAELADELSLPGDEVRAALAVLGARGLAGFDLSRGSYFHRELPFDLEIVEQLQPRLQGARKLLEDKKLKLVSRGAAPQETDIDVEVAGTDVMHLVRLRADGDKCTCPWFSKYRAQRGPCKHILAARILIDGDDNGGNDDT